MNNSSRLAQKSISTAGDRIRSIADQLKQETSLQIKATSRILGAAAQISENHDRLIHEVVEMVEDDLAQQTQSPKSVTIKQLQQRFKTLKQAKSHLGIKANTWASLVNQLNSQTTPPNSDERSMSQRLDTVECELQAVRTDLNQALKLLELILQKISKD